MWSMAFLHLFFNHTVHKKLKSPVLWKHRLLFGTLVGKSFRMGVVSRDQGCNASGGKHKFLSLLWHRQPVWQLCLTVLQIPMSWDNSLELLRNVHWWALKKIRWCWGTNGSYKYVWDRVLNKSFHLDTSQSEPLGPNCNTRNPAQKIL